MPSVRKVSVVPEESGPGRLPLRWAVILGFAVLAAAPAAGVAGLPAAIAVFFPVAAAMHVMIG